MSKPVYFVIYDLVVRMSDKRARQLITAVLTGVGSTEMCDYGKAVRRNTDFIDGDGCESDSPAIVGWCSWRGYPCFHVTDFEMDDWRAALACLDQEKEYQAKLKRLAV